MKQYFEASGIQTTYNYSQVKYASGLMKTLNNKPLTGTVISQQKDGSEIQQTYYMGKLTQTKKYDKDEKIVTTKR
jgi:hypothetical protein